ncbi:uncharacterized protein LOC103956133 [Pyrus x bretschneideri]|uniref:uncharacterized protein LOC103956133 n=1 Tax=Pyrus x bretschneideri TaxID=225117 RepID=UPI002030A2BD|nr:uncharacterized protein LOC103956133 [Pyrus x bretschneideri]
MTRATPEVEEMSPSKSNPNNKPPHQKPHRPTLSPIACCSPKLSLYILSACVTLFIILHIQSLQTQDPTPSSWSMHRWRRDTNTTTSSAAAEMTDKHRHAVTFLPLKDLRYSGPAALQGHTWFMSSMYDHQDEEGGVQYQGFPSPFSHGRLLCLKGRDNHDGSWNSYALAYPEALPHNATLMKGLTFVSYNHYNYDNIWHGLSAVVPFMAWHIKNSCKIPKRWVLYHWGEMRGRMGVWLGNLMVATFGGAQHVEVFEEVEEGRAVCFEEAVVMRHNEGGMSREKRMEVYDLMRCKARLYCNVSSGSFSLDHLEQGQQQHEHERRDVIPPIGITLFMRTGPRSFKNDTAVIEIFERECAKVDGCRLMVAYSNNLTFCDQVQIMSRTDVLVSPHGAQLTNMFLMNRNSSVMEFFPKGWLKLAGVGQYVFHWIASWSGMRHKGAWRDPVGDPCEFGEDDRRCMSIYKSGKIGHNETYLTQWTRDVLNEVKATKMEQAAISTSNEACLCS